MDSKNNVKHVLPENVLENQYSRGDCWNPINGYSVTTCCVCSSQENRFPTLYM